MQKKLGESPGTGDLNQPKGYSTPWDVKPSVQTESSYPGWPVWAQEGGVSNCIVHHLFLLFYHLLLLLYFTLFLTIKLSLSQHTSLIILPVPLEHEEGRKGGLSEQQCGASFPAGFKTTSEEKHAPTESSDFPPNWVSARKKCQVFSETTGVWLYFQIFQRKFRN